LREKISAGKDPGDVFRRAFRPIHEKDGDKKATYFRYRSFGFKSFAESSLERVRREIFKKFIDFSGASSSDYVLDVGASAQDHPSSNFFEQYYPYKNRLTALGLGDFYELESIYPGVRYVRGDGSSLPFGDLSFDWVFSHAVIEHAGGDASQEQFISQMLRVARKGVFLTSPSRLHPFEFHTGLPLIHYLPKRMHLSVYKKIGYEFYSRRENLNLLYPWHFFLRIESVLRKDGLEELMRVEKDFVRWMGFASNIIYKITRPGPRIL
jgi:hypothetical protein